MATYAYIIVTLHRDKNEIFDTSTMTWGSATTYLNTQGTAGYQIVAATTLTNGDIRLVLQKSSTDP